ncbi:hypothetical protein [Rhizobium sp. 18065]|uniref:hypothetical protein n=1 Tax=Rhizobium sp. 18065 TaxID=2681411 RepID=UPI001FCF1732|nr:hypothetical protein [Rhizobium sp. 18065]
MHVIDAGLQCPADLPSQGFRNHVEKGGFASTCRRAQKDDTGSFTSDAISEARAGQDHGHAGSIGEKSAVTYTMSSKNYTFCRLLAWRQKGMFEP